MYVYIRPAGAPSRVPSPDSLVERSPLRWPPTPDESSSRTGCTATFLDLWRGPIWETVGPVACRVAKTPARAPPPARGSLQSPSLFGWLTNQKIRRPHETPIRRRSASQADCRWVAGGDGPAGFEGATIAEVAAIQLIYLLSATSPDFLPIGSSASSVKRFLAGRLAPPGSPTSAKPSDPQNAAQARRRTE